MKLKVRELTYSITRLENKFKLVGGEGSLRIRGSKDPGSYPPGTVK